MLYPLAEGGAEETEETEETEERFELAAAGEPRVEPGGDRPETPALAAREFAFESPLGLIEWEAANCPGEGPRGEPAK